MRRWFLQRKVHWNAILDILICHRGLTRFEYAMSVEGPEERKERARLLCGRAIENSQHGIIDNILMLEEGAKVVERIQQVG